MKWLVAIAAVILVAIAAYSLLGIVSGGRLVTGTVERVTGDIVRVSGFSPLLIKGIVILITIPFFWAVANYTKRWWGYSPLAPGLELYMNRYGLVIVVYAALYFLSMFAVSRSSFVDMQGNVLKYCADTPEGIKVFDTEGVDPIYGIKAVPCTPSQVKAIRQRDAGVRGPGRLTVTSPRQHAFFDKFTGRPKVYYALVPGGGYELFDGPGVHPTTGKPLQPVDAPTIERIIRLTESSQHEEARRQQAEAESAASKRKEAESAAALQRQQEENAAALQRQEAVIARFVNPGPANDPSRIEVGLSADDPRRLQGCLGALSTTIRDRGLAPVEGVLTPAFVTEGRASRLASGAAAVLDGLQLGERIDFLISVTHSASVTASEQQAGLFSARMSVSISCVAMKSNRYCGQKMISGLGVGFSREVASQDAANKIVPACQDAVRAFVFPE